MVAKNKGGDATVIAGSCSKGTREGKLTKIEKNILINSIYWLGEKN